MDNNYIRGGYILKPRCIKDSWISKAPPVVRETWEWLLLNANHATVRYGGYSLNRGQLFCSYKDIREGLCWYIGYRKQMYSEDQMKHGMKTLMNNDMITSTKAPRGNIITICNYSRYQDPENYESTGRRIKAEPSNTPTEHHSSTSINKNVNNVKNEEKIVTSEADAPRNGVPYKKIIDLYHEKCPMLPKVSVLTSKRKTAIRSRWNEELLGDIDAWGNYFDYVSNTPFLCGQNDRGWRADIDFLTKPETAVKCQEGKYSEIQ